MLYIVPINNCRDLIVKVFVIGYRERGESIVILFLEGNNVLYSIVYAVGDSVDVYHKQK